MNLHWPGLPDVGAVVADGAVRGEFADARHVQHGHARPVRGVAEGLIDAILAIDVGLVIGKKHVGIVVEQRLHEGVEETAVTVREFAAGESVDDLAQFRVGFVYGAGMVPRGAFLFDLLVGEAEEEEVVGADLFANLDVGAVESAHSERAVHGELHVAGAGSLQAGEGDLLRKVGGGIDALAEQFSSGRGPRGRRE